METQELDHIVKNWQAKKTKKATQWAFSVLQVGSHTKNQFPFSITLKQQLHRKKSSENKFPTPEIYNR